MHIDWRAEAWDVLNWRGRHILVGLGRVVVVTVYVVMVVKVVPLHVMERRRDLVAGRVAAAAVTDRAGVQVVVHICPFCGRLVSSGGG